MAATRSRILLWSALSGLAWALAWPAVGGLFPLAFVAWLPLLHAERLHDRRTIERRRSFLPYVLCCTLIWNAACAWWFYAVSEPLGTSLVSGTAPVLLNSLFMLVPWWAKRIVQRRWGGAVGTWSFIALWIAFERLHHGWDLQWPWFSLGNVLGAHPAWMQWYDITGMLGGSLWILVVNVLADRAVQAWSSARPRALRRAAWALGVFVVPLALSLWRFHGHVEEGPSMEVVVVQPNIDPYDQKFGGVAAMDQLDGMIALAEKVVTDSTRLVIFPETALQEASTVDLASGTPVFQGLWENDLAASRSVHRLQGFRVRHPRVAVLSGMSSDSLLSAMPLPVTARPLFSDLAPDAPQQRWYGSYNAALFLPVGGPLAIYHKSKLVAGVELMPFEEVLGPLGELALDLGGTTGSLGQQEERSVLVDPASGARIVPAICYESVFGEHLAAHVRNGGNLIAIMTNDGWWGNSPGYRQHLTFASIRAIETRRAVARSANTGISCFVDQRGVVRERSDWWVPDARRSVVRLNTRITFFVAHGDLIGRAAVAIACGLLIACALVALRRKPQ